LPNPEPLRRFKQESQALGRLQHCGIAQIHEAGIADTGSVVQPLLRDGICSWARYHRVRENAQSRYEATLRTDGDICNAMEHADSRGIIHPDLKPSNILLDESGQVKMPDFE
jgi:eukaryotic-like serine/threonine-protein kinase